MAFANPLSAGTPASSRTAGPRSASRARAHLDPRLIVGLVLVLASVAAVVGIVSAADRAVPVYAAAATLTPGERIDAADLVERRVVLDGADRLYLVPTALPSGGMVVTRTVAKGELVPMAALGSAATADLTSVVLTVDGRLAASVGAGADVDVWAVPVPAADGTAAVPPSVLATATVARVLPQEGVVDRDSTSVEMLVPEDRIARLLQARADGDGFALVPRGLALGGGS